MNSKTLHHFINRLAAAAVTVLALFLLISADTFAKEQDGLHIQGLVQVTAGKQTKLSIRQEDGSLYEGSVRWESANHHIAVVSDEGVVTSGLVKEKRGTRINAELEDGTVLEKYIDVVPEVTSLDIIRSEKNVNSQRFVFYNDVISKEDSGKVMELSAKCMPADASQKVIWKSSNRDVAEVSGSGTVRFKGCGYTVISATATDGSGVMSKISVFVAEKIKTIDIEAADMPDTEFCIGGRYVDYPVLSAGSEIQLYTQITPDDAEYAEIIWKSSEGGIVSVDEYGYVRAKDCREIHDVTLWALSKEDESIVDDFTFKVAPKFELMYAGEKVNEGRIDMVMMPDYDKIKLTLEHDFANPGKLTFSSDDSDVCVVESDGTIKAVGEGHAVIRALLECGADTYIIAKVNVYTHKEDELSRYELVQIINSVDRNYTQNVGTEATELVISCIGDSITFGTKLLNDVDYSEIVYPRYLGEYLKADRVYTLGVGGMPISRVVKNTSKKEWGYYDWNPCLYDLIFDDNVNPTDSDKNNPNEEYFSEENIERLENSDVIVVMGGVNDSFQPISGDSEAKLRFGSTKDLNEKTFCGDVHRFIRRLKEISPDAGIIFFTPTKNTVSDGNGMLPLKKYTEAIKDICKSNDVFVVDNYGQNFMDTNDKELREKYMPDGVHGNAAGNRVIAAHVASWILMAAEDS